MILSFRLRFPREALQTSSIAPEAAVYLDIFAEEEITSIDEEFAVQIALDEGHPVCSWIATRDAFDGVIQNRTAG